MTDANKPQGDYSPDLDELITLSEAAEKSGLSHSHIRLLVREGEIWGKKVGNFWFTTEKAVKDYLARDIRPGRKPKNIS